MVGTSFSMGIMRLTANKSKDVSEIAIISKYIMFLNRKLMLPSLLILAVTGIGITYYIGIPFSSYWIIVSLVLMLLILVAFFWGKYMEGNMEKIALKSYHDKDKMLNKRYWHFDKFGTIIGFSAARILSIK